MADLKRTENLHQVVL